MMQHSKCPDVQLISGSHAPSHNKTHAITRTLKYLVLSVAAAKMLHTMILTKSCKTRMC